MSIHSLIKKTCKELTKTSDFQDFLSKNRVYPGDIIVINNSFLYRENFGTTKSEYYLCYEIKSKGKLPPEPAVISWGSQNSPFKVIKHGSANKPTPLPLSQAISTGIGDFGQIPLILIGRIDDQKILQVPIETKELKTLKADPKQNDTVKISGNVVIIRSLNDEELIWGNVQSHLIALGLTSEVLPGIRERIAQAFKEMRKIAQASIILPNKTVSKSNILSRFILSLEESVAEYSASLKICQGDPNIDSSHYNNLLRISYNFSTDAFKFIQIIINLCDLKPIVQWATSSAHFQLHKALQALPWQQSLKKEGISSYLATIRGTRNASFHKLLNLDRSLTVAFEDGALQEPILTFFSSYQPGSTKNTFSFRDQKLIDRFLDLTRADEKYVTPRFWQANEKVMQSTVRLMNATHYALGTIVKEV